eukprot:TRINITY_DN16209_c0_g2_i2.p1 TRINITY_DN16209_c0_g2~~TRINITY_DN16209_c0_g2_i2.p1  ORF type:complete len:277 (-),score=55.19 TRINITY_DN16209_c0_g2_i2:204-1034(-)
MCIRDRYMGCKPRNMKGYIFTKRNVSPVPLMRSGTEKNLALNRSGHDFLNPRNQWNKSNTMQVNMQTIKKLKKDHQDDDYTIAEEFNENEQHISTNLAKREVEKLYKFPKLSNTPKAKSGAQEIVSADRKRSSSYMSTNRQWRHLFSRRSNARLATARPILDIIKEEQRTIRKHRQRTSSAERRERKSISQKENIATARISYETKETNTKSSDARIGNRLQNEIKAMVSKGLHKFSNTAQAKPKILTKRDELLGESSEAPGDELVTIRRKKKIVIP